MRVEVREAITFTWLVLAAFFAITAFGAKKPVREESGASRLYYTLLMGTVFGLLFSQHFRIAQLGLRIVTSPEAAYTGLALVVAGAAFAIWARLTLGGNWSARVTIRWCTAVLIARCAIPSMQALYWPCLELRSPKGKRAAFWL